MLKHATGMFFTQGRYVGLPGKTVVIIDKLLFESQWQSAKLYRSLRASAHTGVAISRLEAESWSKYKHFTPIGGIATSLKLLAMTGIVYTSNNFFIAVPFGGRFGKYGLFCVELCCIMNTSLIPAQCYCIERRPEYGF